MRTLGFIDTLTTGEEGKATRCGVTVSGGKGTKKKRHQHCKDFPQLNSTPTSKAPSSHRKCADHGRNKRDPRTAVLTISAQLIRTSAMRLSILALLGFCCLTAYVAEGESCNGGRQAGRWAHPWALTCPEPNGKDHFDSGGPCRFQRRRELG